MLSDNISDEFLEVGPLLSLCNTLLITLKGWTGN